MENASKALIIAGAILISILLISVGIIVMNAINDPISQAGSSAESQATEIFNSKFTAYMGKDQDYSAVKSLFTTITSVNASSDVKSGGDARKILVNGEAPGVKGTTDAPSSVGDLEKSAKYTVEITDEKPTGGDGYYETVKVTKQK